MKRFLALVIAMSASVSTTATAQVRPMEIRLAAFDGRSWIVPGDDGRTTIIAFWDSACPPCLVELASLPKLARDNPNIRFVAAGLESRDVQRRTLSRFKVSGVELAVATPATVSRLGNPRGALPFATFHQSGGGTCEQLTGALTQAALSARAQRCQQ